jgi:uncharacterized membrane protein
MLVGLPVEQVYEKWHDYAAHAGYTKGVISVDVTNEGQQADEQEGTEEQREETNWKAKVWWSNRSWKATTVEDVPNERVRWKTEGAKGTVDGVITFTGLKDNLTLILIVIEYRPKGMFEWTANRWRTAGRRVRLDLKHFRRFVMMEETEQEQDQDEPDQDEQQDEQQDEAPQDEAEHDADEPNGHRQGRKLSKPSQQPARRRTAKEPAGRR